MNPARMLATLLTVWMVLPLSGCGAENFDSWMPVATRQFVAPLSGSATIVEVRNTAEGWVERIEVRGTGGAGIEARFLKVDSRVAFDGEAASFFRSEIALPLDGETSFGRALALRDWVHRRAFTTFAGNPDLEPSGEGGSAEELDGRATLARIDAGAKFNCRGLATVYNDALRAYGLTSRRVDLAVRHGSPREGHSVVEVWCAELSRWVLMDPFFDAHYEIGGRPANALELHRAFRDRRLAGVRLVRAGGRPGPDPWTYRINPIQYFRNISLQLPSGAWLDFTPDPAKIGLVGRPGRYVTESDAAFIAAPGTLEAEPVYIREAGDRLVYQVIGNELFVLIGENPFATGGCEIRTLKGLGGAFLPEITGYDPDDDVLCHAGDLNPNGALGDTDGDGTPDGWRVVGTPARIVREGERLIVETGSEGVEIIAPVNAANGDILVVTGRIGVERGACSLGLADRKPETLAAIGPGPVGFASTGLIRAHEVNLVRLAVAPQTRCVVESISVRKGRSLAEFIPKP